MDLEIVNDGERGLIARDRETGEEVPVPIDELDVKSTYSESGEFTSLNTEELDNIFHAENFDGADGGEQIQTAIDTANAASGNNAVRVGPVGPDSNEEWRYSSALELHDNTTLLLVGAYLKATQNVNAIRNSDLSDGNENIAVIGENATVDCDATNITDDNSIEDLGITFFKVDNLTIKGSLTITDTQAYACTPELCTDVNISGVRVDQTGASDNQDGIKIYASEDVTVGNCRVKSEDDPFSLVTQGDVKYRRSMGGDCKNVTVNGFVAEDAGSTAQKGLLFVPGSEENPNAGYTIENVTISNYVARGVFDCIRIGAPYKQPTAEELRDITVSNFHFEGEGAGVVTGVNSKNFTFVNGTFETGSRGFQTDNSAETHTLNDWTFNNVKFEHTGDGTVAFFQLKDPDAFDNVTIDNVTAEGYGNGIDIQGTATGQVLNTQIVGASLSADENLGDLVVDKRSTPLREGTFTHTGGSNTTGIAFVLGDSETRHYEVEASVDSTNFSGVDYQYDGIVEQLQRKWDSGNSRQEMRGDLSWATDPGSGNDVTFGWKVWPQ